MTNPRRSAASGKRFAVTVLALSALGLLAFGADYFGSSARENGAANLQRRDAGAFVRGGECRLVHSAKDQCAFVRENCPDEESGIFSYLNLYYCRLEHAKPLAFIIIVLWAGLLFTTIGVAASDFFCVNLSTIAHILGMSESMAGVTFLAFGNGSPDVFSTFSAIKSHSGSLAIGELIGAAGFITAVVSGSMAIVRPFKVAKRSFVRDIGFFIVAVSFSMVFLANGKLNIWECAVMVAFYIFYVVFVLVWHWWLSRARRRREVEAAARGHFTIPGQDEIEFEEEYHDDDDPSTGSRPSMSRNVSVQDFNDLERADLNDPDGLGDLDEDEVRNKWMGELTSNMRVTKPPDGERRNVFPPIRPSLVGALEFRAVLSSLQKSRNIQSIPITMRRYSDAPYYTTAQQQDTHSTADGPVTAQSAYEASIQEYRDDLLDEPRRGIDGRGTTGNRMRAVSANDADGLRLDPTALSREVSSNQQLLDIGPPRLVHSPDHLDAAEQRDETVSSNQRVSSPLLSVSPPPPESREAPSVEPSTRSRSGTQDLLAPPTPEVADAQRHGKSTELSHTLDEQPSSTSVAEHPQLQLAVPTARRASPRVSPSHSPFVPYRDDPPSPGKPPSLTLPPPSASSESFTPKFLTSAISKPLKWWPYNILPPPETIFRTLFPTMFTWRGKTVWEKFLGVCTAPSFFFLTITLPVVDPQKEQQLAPEWMPKTPEQSAIQDFGANPKRSVPTHGGHEVATAAVSLEASRDHASDPLATPSEVEPTPLPTEPSPHATSTGDSWNRWLVIIHCFTAPFFIVLVVWANASRNPKDLLKPSLYSLLGSLIFLLLLLLFTKPSRPPTWHWVLCFAGFAVSITWISTIADEVVGVLKTIGVICNISDAILGLTIFAVGNSLGDLVADITVARLGFPVMALSACFGGPLLNILLGIGIACAFAIIRKTRNHQDDHPGGGFHFKTYHIELSTTLLISAVSLLVTLIGLLIAVPLNKWKMDRRIGIGLCAIWGVTTVVNVVVEISGLGEKLTG